MANEHPRFQLVLDFDGTITMADTTSIIGEAVLAKARELATPELPKGLLPKSMHFYSDQYMKGYRKWKDTNLRPEFQCSTIRDEVAHLSTSEDVERESFLRVRNAALENSSGMANISQNDALVSDLMMNAGRQAVQRGEVRIREAAVLKKLIALANKDCNSLGIVSVSWSRRFILGCLSESGILDLSQIEHLASYVRCNELLAPLAYRNEKPRVLCTAKDKLHAMEGLLAQWDAENGPKALSRPVSSREKEATICIYVGDSITDLGCLAGLSIGMYVNSGGTDDSVLQTLHRLNVECLPVGSLPPADSPAKLLDMLDGLESQGKPRAIVCSIQTLDELYQWIADVH